MCTCDTVCVCVFVHIWCCCCEHFVRLSRIVFFVYLKCMNTFFMFCALYWGLLIFRFCLVVNIFVLRLLRQVLLCRLCAESSINVPKFAWAKQPNFWSVERAFAYTISWSLVWTLQRNSKSKCSWMATTPNKENNALNIGITILKLGNNKETIYKKYKKKNTYMSVFVFCSFLNSCFIQNCKGLNVIINIIILFKYW